MKRIVMVAVAFILFSGIAWAQDSGRSLYLEVVGRHIQASPLNGWPADPSSNTLGIRFGLYGERHVLNLLGVDFGQNVMESAIFSFVPLSPEYRFRVNKNISFGGGFTAVHDSRAKELYSKKRDLVDQDLKMRFSEGFVNNTFPKNLATDYPVIYLTFRIDLPKGAFVGLNMGRVLGDVNLYNPDEMGYETPPSMREEGLSLDALVKIPADKVSYSSLNVGWRLSF